MTKLALATLVFVALFGLLAWIYDQYARLLIAYKLNDKGLSIILFGFFRLLDVPYAEMSGASEVSIWNLLAQDFKTARLSNRILGRYIAITKRSGFIRRIIITPGDAGKFLDDIHQSLSE